MEESDAILLSSYKQMKFPVREQVAKLSDLTSEDVQNICIQALTLFKVDTAPIRQLGKTQKFRVATKVNQELTKNLGTQFELNDLMNNNVDVFRKILITLLSKLSMLEQNDNQKGGASSNLNGNQLNERQHKNLQTFKNWLGQEWIHPSLVRNVKVEFNSHRLKYDFNEDIAKKNILKDFAEGTLKYNIQPILNDMFNNYVAIKKKAEAEQGLVVNRGAGSKALERQILEIRENNADQWVALKNNTKKINRLKKRLVESAKSQAQSLVQQQKTDENTVFQQQVKQLVSQDILKQQLLSNKQNTDEVKQQDRDEQVEQSKDPIVALKRQTEKVKKAHEAEIQAMADIVKKKEKVIAKIEDREAKLEEKAVQEEQRQTSLKTTIVKAKKEAQNKKVLLNSIEVPEQLINEVKALKADLAELTVQAREEVDRMTTEVKTLEETGVDRMKILTEMKEKLTKVETDYARVVREINEKTIEKSKVQVPTSGITRNFYNKRISDMDVRWRTARQEIAKAQAELKNTQTNITVALSTAHRLQTEIENILNMDKNKNQTLNKLIREQYERYRATFKDTLKATTSASECKVESRDYESKVAELMGKSYKQSIQKINFALEDIKKELSQRRAQRK